MKNKGRSWKQNLDTKNQSYFLNWWIDRYKNQWILFVNNYVVATFENEESAKLFRRFILIPYMKKAYVSMPQGIKTKNLPILKKKNEN